MFDIVLIIASIISAIGFFIAFSISFDVIEIVLGSPVSISLPLISFADSATADSAEPNSIFNFSACTFPITTFCVFFK